MVKRRKGRYSRWNIVAERCSWRPFRDDWWPSVGRCPSQFLKQLSRCPVPIRVLLEMRDPSRVTSFSGRSTGSRNRKANRNDHLFRIRPLPSSSFIAQTASRASSLQSRDDQVRSFVDSWRGIATRVNRRAKNVYRGWEYLARIEKDFRRKKNGGRNYSWKVGRNWRLKSGGWY